MKSQNIMNSYSRTDLTFKCGRGVWLHDYNNKKYLDATSGYGVCALGHSNKRIARCIAKQAKKLLHVSNLYNIPEQERLALELNNWSGMGQGFFCNSGAEANEAAIKLARKYGHQCGYADSIIITLKNSFHGRTFGALSATDCNQIKSPFAPLLPGFVSVDANSISAIENIINIEKQVVAVLIEPILGVGGIEVLPVELLRSLRKLCDQNQLLLIADEVQTGIGRTGFFYCYQSADILPDIVTSAKALANGIPIGACLATNKIGDLFGPGDHGSTFGGNPFAASVALEVLSIIREDEIIQHVNNISKYFFEKLKECAEKKDWIKDVRGRGLMIGIDVVSESLASKIVKMCMEQCLLVSKVNKTVIRLLPPLIIKKKEVDIMLNILSDVFESCGAEC